eukprot:COSAG01_NODE_42090_length_443_cov_7.476744_1_plen_63_part_10
MLSDSTQKHSITLLLGCACPLSVMKATSPLSASAPAALCLDVAAEFTAQNGGVAPREEELRSV